MVDVAFGVLKGAFSVFKSYKKKLSEIEGIAEDAEELGDRIDMLEQSISSLITEDVIKRMEKDSKNPLDLTIKKMNEINEYLKQVEKFGEKHKKSSNLKLVFAAVAGNSVASLPEPMQACAQAVVGELGELPEKKFTKFFEQLQARVQHLTLFLTVSGVKPGEGGETVKGERQELVRLASTILTEEIEEAKGNVYCRNIRINKSQWLACWVVIIGDEMDEPKAYWVGVRAKPDPQIVLQVNYFMLAGLGDLESEEISYIGSGFFLSYSDGIQKYLDRMKMEDPESYQTTMKFLKMPIPYADEGCATNAVPEIQKGHVYNRAHMAKWCGCCKAQGEFECMLKTQSGEVHFACTSDLSEITVNGHTYYA